MAHIYTELFLLISILASQHGIGSTIRIEIDQKSTGKMKNEVTISCLQDESPHTVLKPIIIKVGRQGEKPLAIIDQGSHVYLTDGMNNNYKAEGYFGQGKMSNFLRLKIMNPSLNDTGEYNCNIFYLDVEGEIERHIASANLTVERLIGIVNGWDVSAVASDAVIRQDATFQCNLDLADINQKTDHFASTLEITSDPPPADGKIYYVRESLVIDRVFNDPSTINSRYSYNSSTRTMTIRSVECTDEKTFVCKLVVLISKQGAQSKESKASFAVKVPPLTPNAMTTRPMDVTGDVNEGDDVTATCNANIGRPGRGRIEWRFYRDNVEEILNDKDHQIISYQTSPQPSQEPCTVKRYSSVTLLNLGIQDQNLVLTCFVINDDFPSNLSNYDSEQQRLCQQSETIRVHYSVRDIQVSHTPQSDIVVGQSVTLRCRASGFPQPKYQWFKEGDNRTLTSTMNGAFSQLVLTNVALDDDSGNYTCTAHNVVNGITHTVWDKVHVNIEDTVIKIEYIVPPVLVSLIIVVVIIVICFVRRRRLRLKTDPPSQNELSHIPVNDTQKHEHRVVPPKISRIPADVPHTDGPYNEIQDYQSRAIKIQDFKTHVAAFHKNSSLLFRKEFEELQTMTRHPKESCHPPSARSNRESDDHYGGILITPNVDASFIPGLNSRREYIATKGPNHAAIQDFWKMVWENKSQVIVMLSDRTQNDTKKTQQYWPNNTEPVTFGEFKIEVIHFSKVDKFFIGEYRITMGNVDRRVTHFFLPAWWDDRGNMSSKDILGFLHAVREKVAADNPGPLIVQCRAGLDKTGVFIALDHFMQHMDRHSLDDDIDVFEYIQEMRRIQSSLVQDETSYIFIFDTVVELVQRKMERDNLYESMYDMLDNPDTEHQQQYQVLVTPPNMYDHTDTEHQQQYQVLTKSPQVPDYLEPTAAVKTIDANTRQHGNVTQPKLSDYVEPAGDTYFGDRYPNGNQMEQAGDYLEPEPMLQIDIIEKSETKMNC